MLTVGGVQLGMIDGFERAAELEPDGVFCEASPCGFLPVKFCFSEAFLLAPPPRVALYFTRTGVAIYFHDFLREDAAMHIVRQETVARTRMTLYVQGRVQLALENETGFHLLDLPDAFENAAFSAAENELLLEGESSFCILSRAGEVLLRADGKILSRGKTVEAELEFHDSCGHSAVCEYAAGKLVSCKIRAKSPPTEATYALALFESVLIGADPAPFLSDTLAQKAGDLYRYLGEYVSVVLTEKQDEVGLVYPRGDGIFDVRYFRVIKSGEKIENILPL